MPGPARPGPPPNSSHLSVRAVDARIAITTGVYRLATTLLGHHRQPAVELAARFHYAGRQRWQRIAKTLKPVYTAPTEAAAREQFAEFTEIWSARYPATIRLWDNAWAALVPFLAFDPEIRRVICSPNAIESVKARGHFPNEQAALKCVYMAIMGLDPHRHRPQTLARPDASSSTSTRVTPLD